MAYKQKRSSVGKQTNWGKKFYTHKEEKEIMKNWSDSRKAKYKETEKGMKELGIDKIKRKYRDLRYPYDDAKKIYLIKNKIDELSEQAVHAGDFKKKRINNKIKKLKDKLPARAIAKQTQEEWDSYSDKKKKRLMEKGVKKETRAHEKYHGKSGKEGKGERIEKKLNLAKRPGGTTTLGRVKYKYLVNKLDKIYKGMYPDPDESNIKDTYGPWKPSKK